MKKSWQEFYISSSIFPTTKQPLSPQKRKFTNAARFLFTQTFRYTCKLSKSTIKKPKKKKLTHPKLKSGNLINRKLKKKTLKILIWDWGTLPSIVFFSGYPLFSFFFKALSSDLKSKYEHPFLQSKIWVFHWRSFYKSYMGGGCCFFFLPFFFLH